MLVLILLRALILLEVLAISFILHNQLFPT